MKLGDLDTKDLKEDLQESRFSSNYVSKFIQELQNFFEKDDNKLNNEVVQNKYSNYWKYQNFIEDNASAQIGLSRWGANNTYNLKINQAVNDSLLELSKNGKTIYRKKFASNGSGKDAFFNVDKFEKGEIYHLTIPKDVIPKEFENKDIIFQLNNNNKFRLRNDLKEQTISLTSNKISELKEKENKRNLEYKKEGHTYKVVEDEGYVFLNDITEKSDFSIEDIDFTVDVYAGDGIYQVINGEYKKID